METIVDKVPNFVIVYQEKCKAPLIDGIDVYYWENDISDKIFMVTDKNYGEKIIVSKGDNKVTLTRMDTVSRTIEDTARKLIVSYIDSTGIMCLKSFYSPMYYLEPTAYVVSEKEFVSAIGENNFYWLVRGKRAFSLYDPKYAKTYSMNFEAINKTCLDIINISYKAEIPPDTMIANWYIMHHLKEAQTAFDNMDILKDNMKSFIKKAKEKYNITYSEWNCKVYIKSYSYYDGKYTMEEEHNLNSETFLEAAHF